MRMFVFAAAATLIAAPALAQPYGAPAYGPNQGYYDPDVTGSIGPAPGDYGREMAPRSGPGGYSFNPAAEGNADQQSKPVKNYGQVSGGPAAAGEW